MFFIPCLGFLQGMSMPAGMVPMVKRPAVADSKSGIPMYQPGTGTTAYQQAALAAMQLQQPFVPVTSEFSAHPCIVFSFISATCFLYCLIFNYAIVCLFCMPFYLFHVCPQAAN